MLLNHIKINIVVKKQVEKIIIFANIALRVKYEKCSKYPKIWTEGIIKLVFLKCTEAEM